MKLMEDRPKVGVGAMLISNDQVLLGRRSKGHGKNHFAFPGGYLENGESLIQCAFREVKEETGLAIVSSGIICAVNFKIHGLHSVDIVLVAEVMTTTPALIEPEKTEMWKWHSLSNLPQPLFPSAKVAIDCHASGSYGIVDLIHE